MVLIHVSRLSVQSYNHVMAIVADGGYIPQSYCMSLVSGNWKHVLVAMGWRKSALGESS